MHDLGRTLDAHPQTPGGNSAHHVAQPGGGIETARAIARSSALAPWGTEKVAPGPDVTDAEALDAYARTAFTSYCHPVGTCALGEDEVSVVDSALRVRGLEGLRVADGSVIPSIPSNNTNATVYAVAERAAEFIREGA
jgi:choline dehydrogenase